MKIKGNLLGFRSGDECKKLIASIWYGIAGLILLGILFIEPYVNATVYDKIIFKLSYFILLLLFLVPPFVYSNFKFKNKIPVLKENKRWNNIAFLGIALLALVICFNLVYTLHTNEYKIRDHNYQEK